jgi:hypothetical protein
MVMLAMTVHGRAASAALVLAASTLLWLGVSPAHAFKGGHFEGGVNLEPNSRISFDLVKTKKQIGSHRWRRTAKVENVVFEQALAGCGASGVLAISTPLPGSVKLKKNQRGRFVLKASSPGLSLSMSGNFVSRFRAVYGEFHLAGSFLVDGTASSCDTGPRGWEAQRTSDTGSG